MFHFSQPCTLQIIFIDNGLCLLVVKNPESRDLLGFYCRASIVYNTMRLTLALTPSFSSPILEENPVGVRNDTFTCTATSS